MRVNRTTRQDGNTYVGFDCPGCKDYHDIPVTGPKAWGFNESLERPTLTPSILAQSRMHTNEGLRVFVCHSFVTDGCIQFLGDCTHDKKGQTVDLPEVT